jgi:hypothetical protein
MVSVARSKDTGWQCPACRKTLAARPLAGRVTKHANGKGDLCHGVGKPAVDLSANSASKGGQRTRGRAVARKKTPKSAPRPAFPIKPSERAVAGVKERPEMLPSKKATGSFTLPKNRIRDEDHWSLFQDAPRQDLETDGGWRRVRLGTSQGTGKRR